MAGKLDNTAYAAAVARIGEVAAHEAELWRHLEEVVEGAAFKGSARSQAFLKHVVEKALHGDPADLRERSIGIALFGRSAAYDTADDAIVRVTASDVRKRLLLHYGKTGADSRFRISLPPGSYVPEFSILPAPPLIPLESPPAPMPPSHPIVLPMPGAEVRFPRRIVVSIALLAVLLVAGGSWWTFGRRPADSATKENLIEAAFRGMPPPVQVVVADDGLVLIQVLLNRRFTLQEYENLTYLNMPDLVQKKDLQRFWGSLSTRQITNIGDLQNAYRIIGGLRARNWDVSIRQARQMHARAFRNGNFVILGSSFSNPWAALFPVEDSNFPYEDLPAPGKPEVILNRHPLPGEPARFEAHQDAKTGEKITFARVYLVQNVARRGRVIVVAGQSMSATEMAGELMLGDELAAKVRKMLALRATGSIPDLEMVVRASEQNEIGGRVDLVAARKIEHRSE